MESTRPIRALLRGLDALSVLNLRSGATVSEVAAEIRLPRTTTYRILETLCHAGYVFRDPDDDRYRLTSTVRGLSDGFDDEAWLIQIADLPLRELSRAISLPVAIATLSGTTMRIHELIAPGPDSPERYVIGVRVPLMTTAPGRTYLAYCADKQRASLLELLARSRRDEDHLARDLSAVAQLVADVRALGYGTASQTRRMSDETSVAVPVCVGERLLACLVARLSSGPAPAGGVVPEILPALRAAADALGTRFREQAPAARTPESGTGPARE